MFADVELGRAHQVSDVLYNDQVQLRKVQALQSPVDHGRVQMAFATETVVGVQQRDLRAPAAEFGGVEIGGDIALDDSDAEFAGQLVEGGRQHGGLTRSRRAHQIQRANSIGLERVTVHRGAVVVLGEDRLQDLDALGAGRVATVIAEMVGIVVMTMIAVVVAVLSTVVVAVKPTHGSPYVTSTEVTRNSSPRTTSTSPLSHCGQSTDQRDSIWDCLPHARQDTSAGTNSSSSSASGMSS